MDGRLAGAAVTSSLLASVGAVANGRVSQRAPPRAARAAAGGRREARREFRWGRAAGPGVGVVSEEGVRGARMRSLLLVSPSAAAGIGGSCEGRGADREFARAWARIAGMRLID